MAILEFNKDAYKTIISKTPVSFELVLDSFFGVMQGQFVDTDKYDIFPKKTYLDDEIRHKEEEIQENERAHEASNKYYKNREEYLKSKKEKLIAQRGKVK